VKEYFSIIRARFAFAIGGRERERRKRIFIHIMVQYLCKLLHDIDLFAIFSSRLIFCFSPLSPPRRRSFLCFCVPTLFRRDKTSCSVCRILLRRPLDVLVNDDKYFRRTNFQISIKQKATKKKFLSSPKDEKRFLN
jgi:hypothetical protein